MDEERIIKLNIGCGVEGNDLMVGNEWVNVDLEEGEGVDVVANCCQLPYDRESINHIRSYHMVEHLTKPELKAFAVECLRVLKPGGTLEIVAPAMDTALDIYYKNKESESIEIENFPISPLDWMDNFLFARHLHATDFHKQGIYPSKLQRVFRQFTLHQFRHRDRDCSKYELCMTCQKPDSPRCSIVMSTRNKAKQLDMSLASIYKQNIPFSFEVIVVDDGSTDKTREVCEKYGVQYHFCKNDRYRNPSFARNVGYKAARGKVIIAQSDDIIHISPNTVEYLVTDLKEGECLFAQVHNYKYKQGTPNKYVQEYCGPHTPNPYFFLGSLWRKDLYAVGGCDEEFVEPCFDDNWFSDCLLYGIGIVPRFTKRVRGHHIAHEHGKGSHVKEHLSRALYERKVAIAQQTGVWQASSGPWELRTAKPIKRIVDRPITTLPLTKPNTPDGKIPRIMSFFWVGPMSWMRYMTLYSFRYYNPDWRIVLYSTDVLPGNKRWRSTETQDCQTYSGQDYTDQLQGLGIERRQYNPPISNLASVHVCDLCEWDLLSVGGGCYADMDILWTAPMPYRKIQNADAMFCLSSGFMCIGLIGSRPKNKLFQAILNEAVHGYREDHYQSTGAEAIYRLANIERWANVNLPGRKAIIKLDRSFQGQTLVTLPDATVYPWTYQNMEAVFSEINEVPARCVGIHWFGGNNLSQQWNETLTANNWNSYDNTYTRYVQEIYRS